MEGFEGSFMIPPPPGTGPRNDVRGGMEQGSAKEIINQEIADRSYVQVFDVKVFRCTCQRCPKVWITLQTIRPKACPSCTSVYWDRPRTQLSKPPGAKKANGFGLRPRRKKKKGEPKGQVGRPRKHVEPGVDATGSPAQPAVNEIREFPEIPVALLGAVGRPALVPGEGLGPQPDGNEDDFPVATPFNTRAPEPTPVEPVPYPPVEVRQSFDDRGCEIPAGERMPPLPPFDEDEY